MAFPRGYTTKYDDSHNDHSSLRSLVVMVPLDHIAGARFGWGEMGVLLFLLFTAEHMLPSCASVPLMESKLAHASDNAFQYDT